jgi:hypothetical protein
VPIPTSRGFKSELSAQVTILTNLIESFDAHFARRFIVGSAESFLVRTQPLYLTRCVVAQHFDLGQIRNLPNNCVVPVKSPTRSKRDNR